MHAPDFDFRELGAEIAEMGPHPALDNSASEIRELISRRSTFEMVAARLDGDAVRATGWLDALQSELLRALQEPDEDHARLVTQLVVLGDLLAQRQDTQITSAFAALAGG